MKKINKEIEKKQNETAGLTFYTAVLTTDPTLLCSGVERSRFEPMQMST
jgi:hypothetical protein